MKVGKIFVFFSVTDQCKKFSAGQETDPGGSVEPRKNDCSSSTSSSEKAPTTATTTTTTTTTTATAKSVAEGYNVKKKRPKLRSATTPKKPIVRRPHLTPNRKAKIVAEVGQGKTFKAVGEKYGVSERYASRLLKSVMSQNKALTRKKGTGRKPIIDKEMEEAIEDYLVMHK